jgi:hypothetical protein
MRWLWVAVAIAGIAAWHAFSTRPLTLPPGRVAPDDPQQSALAGSMREWKLDGATLIPRARFRAEARVLGREPYRFDRLAKWIPVDLALGWGPMSDTAVLSRLSITQGNRFYFWMARELPIARRAIETHSANVHLIAADAGVARRIDRVRVGQVVRLSGYLVDLVSDEGWTLATSLTREDTGAGSCEVVFVESFE